MPDDQPTQPDKPKHSPLPRCAGRVPDGFHGLCSCARNGAYYEDEKWWCWQHAPSAVKKRDKANLLRYEKKIDATLAEEKKVRALLALRDAVEDIWDLMEDGPDLGNWNHEVISELIAATHAAEKANG